MAINLAEPCSEIEIADALHAISCLTNSEPLTRIIRRLAFERGKLRDELEALKKLERDRWTGWAKEVNIMRMQVCPKCGNKRCPKADGPQWKCNNSNEPGQVYYPEASDEATESKGDE